MSDSLATRLGRPFHAAAQTLWSALFLLFAWLVMLRTETEIDRRRLENAEAAA